MVSPCGVPFDFMRGGGGGGKITLVLDFFSSCAEVWLFIFLRSMVLDFFPARIMRINKQKSLSVDSDQEMDTRLIKCLVL